MKAIQDWLVVGPALMAHRFGRGMEYLPLIIQLLIVFWFVNAV